MKISVITPVYNAEKYITQAVESALQFPEVCEVILVEDKSPDNALEICRNLAEKYSQVKLFQHPDKGNHGAGASRNLGMKNATGDFIAFLDADDYYLPNRFDAERELFKNPEVEGVYCALGTHYYSEKAKEQYFPVYGEKLLTVYKEHPAESVFPGLIGLSGSFGYFSIDALTIRRKCLDKIGTLMKINLKLHQDAEFLFRLAFYCKLFPGIIDKPVAMRGIHESNRISQVDSRKINPAASMGKFWNEVRKWAESEKEMPKSYKTHIARICKSYEIANAAKFKQIWLLLKYFVSDYHVIRSGLYNRNFRRDLL